MATGSTKRVDRHYGEGRLVSAREFKSAANDLLVLGGMARGNVIVSIIVLAAIAYTDAVTAVFKGVVNQQDHQAAPKTLQSAVGNILKQSEKTALAKILDHKDAAQYGARPLTTQQAEELMRKLNQYAEWVEGILAGKYDSSRRA